MSSFTINRSTFTINLSSFSFHRSCKAWCFLAVIVIVNVIVATCAAPYKAML